MGYPAMGGRGGKPAMGGSRTTQQSTRIGRGASEDAQGLDGGGYVSTNGRGIGGTSDVGAGVDAGGGTTHCLVGDLPGGTQTLKTITEFLGCTVRTVREDSGWNLGRWGTCTTTTRCCVRYRTGSYVTLPSCWERVEEGPCYDV